MKFQFSNVVVVDDIYIGVIVKSWSNHTYEVYVRSYNAIITAKEEEIRHFVYDKELSETEYD